MKLVNIIFCLLLASLVTPALAQQAGEVHVPLSDTAVAVDIKGAPAIEAKLLTTALVGSPDSPVTNALLVAKNVSPNFYSYVTGWATFYDAGGVRCGEGLFKVDALEPGELAQTDTPGLRLRCTPATWRIVATNLLTRTSDQAKIAETAPASAEAPIEKPAPVNFVITIDSEEHPIQLNNPIVLKLGNRQRKIVLRSAP